MFYGLQNLEKMDLSFNNFTGRLPISFICLTNLIGLFLQNNQFTGSVMFLANLSLTDMNIEDNYFSGLIPESFQNIINLRIAGNMFVTDYGPWNVPINTMPREKYISATSAAAYLITIESHPSQSVVHKKRKPALKIVMLIVVFTLAATFSLSILFTTRKRHRRNHRRSMNPNDPVSPDESVRSQSPCANLGTCYTSTSGGSSPNTSLSFSLSPSPPITTSSDFTGVELFHFSALRDATNNFGSDCLIEDSDWWRVYKGSFVEGKVYAVKELRNSLLVRTDDESLEEISKLQLWRHPNLVSMIGYCVHEGKIYIISDLVPSKSLASLLYDDPLHLPRLEWSERMVIALQVARGLEFMHQNDALVKNLSALTVFVGDCFRTVIGDVWIPSMFYMHSPKPWLSPGECYVEHADPYKSIRGYNPPESSLYYFVFSKEWDVYSFGILFLVLIKGKEAYDDDVGSSFDMEPLIKRVRPTIEGGLPESMFELVDNDIMVEFPDLEQALDLVYKCTNERMELRPTMSEVVEILQEFI